MSTLGAVIDYLDAEIAKADHELFEWASTDDPINANAMRLGVRLNTLKGVRQVIRDNT